MNTTAQTVIQRLNLEPLTGEGGFFRFITPFGQGSGTIYYLITPDNFSHLHSLTADELYFYLEGDPAQQTLVHPDGSIEHRVLDSQHRDSLVKAGCYQALQIHSPKLGYTLVSTVMSPTYQDDMYQAGRNDPAMWAIEELRSVL